MDERNPLVRIIKIVESKIKTGRTLFPLFNALNKAWLSNNRRSLRNQNTEILFWAVIISGLYQFQVLNRPGWLCFPRHSINLAFHQDFSTVVQKRAFIHSFSGFSKSPYQSPSKDEIWIKSKMLSHSRLIHKVPF